MIVLAAAEDVINCVCVCVCMCHERDVCTPIIDEEKEGGVA